MSYTLNISFIFSEPLETRFSIWCRNNSILENFNLFRVIGSSEGALTYCAQIELDNINLVQQKISELTKDLHFAIKKDFNEEIVYFMSALERL